MNEEPKITLKMDKSGRLCAWLGNVSSRLTYDRWGKLVAPGEHALCRLEGADCEMVIAKLPARYQSLVEQGFAVVLTRKESFL